MSYEIPFECLNQIQFGTAIGNVCRAGRQNEFRRAVRDEFSLVPWPDAWSALVKPNGCANRTPWMAFRVKQPGDRP